MTIQLDEKLVATIGRRNLERQIQQYVDKLLLKMAVEDIMTDTSIDEVSNDPKWELARKMAWEDEREKFQVYFDEAKRVITDIGK